MSTRNNLPTYRDFDLRFLPHPVTGDLVMKTDVGAVMQSIKNLLLTREYDIVMNPEIEGAISDAMFELNGGILLHALKTKVRNVIEAYEPRVELKEVNVFTLQDNRHVIIVEIVFFMLNNPDPYTEQIRLHRTR